MNTRTTGWVWVTGQIAILSVLILLPGGDDWPRPVIVRAIAGALFIGGLVLIGFAALVLRAALTPTPVPSQNATLTTSGLYRFVRHPIYTGLLTTIAGMTLRSGSWRHALLAVVAAGFFDRKAAWEEQQLLSRYPEYVDYAATTPRFIPGLRPTRR